MSDNGERVIEFSKKQPLPPGLTLTPDPKPDKPRSGPAPENEE